MTSDQRLFFDISSMLEYADVHSRYSGIQRVIAMIIAEIAELHPLESVFVSFCDARSGTYKALPLAVLKPETLLDPSALRQALGMRRARVKDHPLLKKYRKRPRRAAIHALKYDLYALLGARRKFTRRGSSRDSWVALRKARFVRAGLLRQNAVVLDEMLRPGDTLLLLDSSWKEAHQAALSRLRARQVRVVTYIHDLIPIMAPYLAPAGAAGMFYRWISETRAVTDLYLCNSQATKRDLKRFLEGKDDSRAEQIGVVPLAQQFPVPRVPSEVPYGLEAVDQAKYPDLLGLEGISDEILRLAAVPFVLCVGTIEARKNNWRLVQAWQRLAQHSPVDPPRLILAGRVGAMSADVTGMLRQTGGAGGLVQILDGPSDTELGFLYRTCQFAVMPSLYEGWGLPVGEALSYGKTAVVANNSSLPEVGGDLVEYCDATSISSIAEACERLITDPAHRGALESRIAATRLRTWRDVAEDLLKQI